jgi:hypothetical protein
MKYLLLSFAISCIICFSSCSSSDPDPGPQTVPIEMLSANLNLDWAITREHEMPCGGDEVGGGAISGMVNFAEIGELLLELSSVWDIANQLDPGEVIYEPEGPAGGPVARVFGKEEYPYNFMFSPFTGQCETVVSATGEMTLTAGTGDIIFGMVEGGETHRLDFVMEGDGIETFARIDIEGGTGQFENATGQFTTHTITRFDFDSNSFVMDLATVLPGGSITYGGLDY